MIALPPSGWRKTQAPVRRRGPDYRPYRLPVRMPMGFLNDLDHDVEVVIRKGREAVGRTSAHPLR